MPLKPEDSQSRPEDNPEDGGINTEDSGRIPRIRRPYHLSEEGRERLSGLGKSRWADEVEAAKREAALSGREERLQRALGTPAEERLRESVQRKIQALPEATSETILRVRGVDYRIENGDLKHLWFPSGKKTDFEENQWFRSGAGLTESARVGLGACPRRPSSRTCSTARAEKWCWSESMVADAESAPALRPLAPPVQLHRCPGLRRAGGPNPIRFRGGRILGDLPILLVRRKVPGADSCGVPGPNLDGERDAPSTVPSERATPAAEAQPGRVRG